MKLDFPSVRHTGNPPAELLKAFKTAFNDVVRRRKGGLSKAVLQRVKRFKAYENDLDLFMASVFERMPSPIIAEYCPPWFVEAHQSMLAYEIRWRCLEQKRINGQTVTYARNRPLISMFGGKWPVGWSRHAVDQLFNRVYLCRHAYSSVCGVAFIVGGMWDVRLEPTRTKHDEPAVDVWVPTGCLYEMVVALAALSSLYVTDYHVHVAHCPVVQEGKFLKCLTAMSPAMTVYRKGDKRSNLLEPTTIYDVFHGGDHQAMETWSEQVSQLHQRRPIVKRFERQRWL